MFGVFIDILSIPGHSRARRLQRAEQRTRAPTLAHPHLQHRARTFTAIRPPHRNLRRHGGHMEVGAQSGPEPHPLRGAGERQRRRRYV